VDIFTFVSSLFRSLAWPLTTLAIAILFRRSLTKLLDRLLEAKFGKYVSLKLAADLQKARRDLHAPEVNPPPVNERTLIPPVTAHPHVTAEDRIAPLPLSEVPENSKADHANQLFGIDPSIEVDASWKELSRALVSRARGAGLKRSQKPERATQYLVENGFVPTEFQPAYDAVYAIYKEIRRHPNLPVDAVLAHEFARTCKRLQAHLQQILDQNSG
jgi:hypothetical protein